MTKNLDSPCFIFCLLWFKSLNFGLFMKFVFLRKTNKFKSLYIVPPLLLEPTYVQYAHVKCREQKRSAKGSNFKEDDRVLPP